MFAFVQVATVATLGYLCVVAGFLVIVASVAFVVKGKMALSESGAPNAIEIGKMKANFTSAIALFVLGAAMIALPFWRFQEEDAQRQVEIAKQEAEKARQPVMALLKGRVRTRSGGDVRMLLVVKPDYDQTYRGEILWEFPLVAKRASYSVLYVDGDKILGQQPFFVEASAPGSARQEVPLPELDLQTDSSGAPVTRSTREVSDEKLKILQIH